MIVPHAYQGKRIGVFGLARTGLAAVRALLAAGAHVWAWDDDVARRKAVPCPAIDLYGADFSGLDALMLAPGVPLHHPQPHALVQKARAAGVPLIGDMDLFDSARQDLPTHKLVAVTGTNGKSTTVALIHHMVKACGRPAALGGNIGIPVLDLDPLPKGGVYVFELSSFQCDLTHNLDADVAVLLNMSPDHLDRHGDMAGYVAAKRRLFEMQSKAHLAVIGVDDAAGRQMAKTLPQSLVPISVRDERVDGVGVTPDGQLVERKDGTAKAVGSLQGLATLRGRHNWQNAAAAYVVGRRLGFSPNAIMAAFADFPGLAHRCEVLGQKGDILVVNDSKATNMEATATALAAYDKILWIAGGRAKSTDLSPLAQFFPHIRHAYLIGEAAADFANALDGHVPVTQCGTVDVASQKAMADAKPGETVLFSPACASFDQFSDFEARGEAFRTALAPFLSGERA
ncbi:UDP-N-acetylmuramoylalanine--D-glutamate ligase [Iodidimonas muriae]|uniref:UDP-N-acetylmuramoylalanine--D-glutamate ligase n=1 Tax=Iodidimonas muriae TaxID=261467 RepID=A0ABQ2LC15_9PROT|nr:UDP-N-acetylmuramoyl-L-alanine--D-glutamate ligase [Iodidimonas muriae]GER06799.1 UDP-N-acetylmuramoylalanine--D-glutamate ligase [Kordiimonadales bacterium JCM 17843]GGO09934.1 UDP-N-acetylmuramoylalanine--D-glutamate ligase [Iodidimonas muriae]